MVGEIKNKARDLGFDLCGIARIRSLDEHGEILDAWLRRGLHAGMSYMERNREKRINPSELVKGARSIIVTAMNYYHEYSPGKDKPVFARYALGRDYHRLMKERLHLLLNFIREKNKAAEGRVFVDTAPVMEKAWAVEAGLGWQGKNSMLISREMGSFLFLGVLLVNIHLDYDKPAPSDYCGKCRKCIEACPTGAILDNRTIDSNRCLSYLTIENKHALPSDYAEKAGGRIFGCDICQEVCPWNMKTKETGIKGFEPLPEILAYTTKQWRNITEDEFYSIFKDSPVLRAGYEGFRRNLG